MDIFCGAIPSQALLTFEGKRTSAKGRRLYQPKQFKISFQAFFFICESFLDIHSNEKLETNIDSSLWIFM
jgi:hypothetical protein